MHSCIYEGKVRHRRFAPVPHEFTYRIWMLMLDLDELESVFKGRLLWSTKRFNFAWFREKDHLRTVRQTNDNQSLKELILSFLKNKGIQSNGPIRLLTQLRYLGFVMNPVTVYYCYQGDGQTLSAIVAQVNNTPWGEEHLYLIHSTDKPSKTISIDHLAKDFHVSPFMPMDMNYSMKFTQPNRKLAVRMINFRESSKILDVIMNLQQKKITSMNLVRVLVSNPLISVKVFVAIYWQALKIYLKRMTFYPHPKKALATAPKDSTIVES